MSAAARVLLVEDNPITRKLVGFALKDEPIELSEATDGAAALASVAAQRPGANSNALADELALDPLSGTSVLNGIPVEVSAA